MYRIVFQISASGKRIVDKCGTVITKYSHTAADSWQHALSTTGEACKKVGFNKAFCYQKIGFYGSPVDYQARSGGQSSQVCQHLFVVTVMDQDTLLFYDFPSQLPDQLFCQCSTVTACGYQKRDLNVRIPLSELLQHKGNELFAPFNSPIRDSSICTTPDSHIFKWVFP